MSSKCCSGCIESYAHGRARRGQPQKKYFNPVRGRASAAHTPGMPRFPSLSEKRDLRPTQTALALELVTEMDLLRLKAVARLYARGLPPDVSWDDLLQEAFTRILVGTRRRPEAGNMLAFVSGVMLSLRSEHRRRALQGLDK